MPDFSIHDIQWECGWPRDKDLSVRGFGYECETPRPELLAETLKTPRENPNSYTIEKD